MAGVLQCAETLRADIELKMVEWENEMVER